MPPSFGPTSFGLRTLLFAPADSPRKIDKALASTADGVILDLEDSVAPAAKAAAREALRARLPTDRPGLMVRVNPNTTPYYLADLASAVPGRPAAIMLPKCTGMADLVALDHHLEALEAANGLPRNGIAVAALMTETAASLLAPDYRGAPRLIALCFGAEDLSADLGIAPRGTGGGYTAPVAAARATTLLAAAAAGVPALDTPWPDPKDPAGLALEAESAARDGFAGKLCIHPDQLAPVAAAFTPTAARMAWARAVVAGFAANPGAGVFALEGMMIDQPHLKLAHRILAAA